MGVDEVSVRGEQKKQDPLREGCLKFEEKPRSMTTMATRLVYRAARGLPGIFGRGEKLACSEEIAIFKGRVGIYNSY